MPPAIINPNAIPIKIASSFICHVELGLKSLEKSRAIKAKYVAMAIIATIAKYQIK